MVNANIDTLAVIDDDELIRFSRSLENGISKVKNKAKVLLLQKDLCYVQREMQIRNDRRKAHDEYVKRSKQPVS